MYSDYICQRCYKPRDILKALGKLSYIDGYEQCKDCHSDLEYESVVIRQIYFDRKKNEGIPYPKWLYDELEKNGLIKKVGPEEIEEIKKFLPSFADKILISDQKTH